MGRKAEKGIRYYQMKSDHTSNMKVRLLFNEFDAAGYWIWSCLLDTIYAKEGYYFDFNNEDELELFALDVCKKQVSLVKEVVAGCLRRSLFNKRVFELFGVLTSDRIQLQFLEATAERRRKGTEVELISEYLVIERKNDGKEWQNIRIVERKRDSSTEQKNNSAEESDKSAEESAKEKKRKEKLEPNGSPGLQPDPAHQALEIDFKNLTPKSLQTVAQFIRKHRPLFDEPYVEMWNLFADEYRLARVKKLSDSRRRKLRIRSREGEFSFPDILAKAARSEFLRSSKWFSWDWIMENQINYLKVLEGNYDNTPTPANGNQKAASQDTVTGYIPKSLV